MCNNVTMKFDHAKFAKWLDGEMEARGIADRADLVRRASGKGYKLSNQVLSNIYAGRREPGKRVCTGIAAGLGMKDATEVFIAAGVIPSPKDSQLSAFEKRVLDLIRGNLKNEKQKEGFYKLTETYIETTRGGDKRSANETDNS